MSGGNRMKRIDVYVDDLVESVYDRQPDELEAFKQEVKSRLNQAAQSLQAQGYSVEDSIQIAIQRFGARDTIIQEMENRYEAHANADVDGNAEGDGDDPKPAAQQLVMKGVSALHLLWGIWILAIALINLIIPKFVQPSAFTPGELNALLSYIPPIGLFILSGIGLWKKQKWGMELSLFIYLTMFVLQVWRIITISGWNGDQLQFFFREGYIVEMIVSILLAVAGVWLMMHKRVYAWFNPDMARMKTFVSYLIIAVLYIVVFQMLRINVNFFFL
ncbi:hypothetical protein EBB07_24295 [Paenibacillaceae bacterium]|nr:hypothetical protein EBB07_24295 [Paenibacillaceae bacterium]